MASEVAVVLVCHGPEHRHAALSALRQLVDRALRGWRATFVVVDNALTGDVEMVLDRSATLVGGDNRQREFSGWERGLDWLAPQGGRARAIVLANDTLHRSYGAEWLAGFSAERAAAALDQGALLGWLDAYPQEVELFGMPLERWVRTSLVLAASETWERLRPFTVQATDDQLFSGDPAAPFREPSPLSRRYRDYLQAWLTGDTGRTPEFGFTWHSAAPLDRENLPFMQGKLRSILCEHQLSARARAAGIPLLDVRY